MPLSATNVTISRFLNQHRSRLTLIYQYLTGQGVLQVLNVLNGFFLLRWLSIDEQAKFSLAMGLQATLGILGDLGFGGSLIGLVGTRVADKELVGRYIRGVTYYKNRLLLICLTIGSLFIFVYKQEHRWGFDFICIYILILISIHAQSQIGYYSAVLQMNRNLRSYYRPQLLLSATRLLLSFLLFSLLTLNAIQVVMLTTVVFVINAQALKRSARHYFIPARRPETAIRSEILRTISPVIPMVFFYAIQGQLATFLIGFYGKTQNIAEIGALSRLGQLFSLLAPFNTVVLMPFFARATSHNLLKRYVIVTAVATCLMMPLISVAYLYEDIFLWLLGDKYTNLQSEIALYIFSAGVAYVASVIWAIDVARNWNRWYTAMFYMLITVVVQIVCIQNMDLSSTHNVILFSLYTALCSVISNLLTSFVGLKRDLIPVRFLDHANA